MLYSAIGLLAIIILLIENHDVILNRNDAFGQSAWRVYRRFLFAVLFYYLTDVLWGVLEEYKLSLPLFIDTTVYFVAMAVGVSFWAQYTVAYLDKKSVFGKVLVLAGRIIAVLITALTVINIFFPVLFTVDGECVYSPLPVRYVILGSQILLLFLISIYSIISIFHDTTEKKRKARTLALFGVIMAALLIVQLWYPYLPLYTIAYLVGTCLLHTFVIKHEKEEYKQGLEDAEKIRELKESISLLLDNMPALSFYKDVETGVYIACNQAFAEYAHKKTPEEVAGLTDFEIFDHAIAEHFVEDDRKALAMDEPYVLFEDVADAAGNPRQFQTTKLKFYDTNGRTCLLGMSMDVTETERVRKEHEKTQAAYKEALSTSAVLENIVIALSEDYFDLYYVDLETNEYVEYGSRTEAGHRSTENRGEDFFEASRKNAQTLIYEEDRERFLRSFKKESILDAINDHGTFIIQYRLIIEGVPTFVNLKAARIGGDDRHMIIGISNIDGQIKDRMAARQADDDRKSYLRLSALNGNLLVLYYVDQVSEQYTEYSSTRDYEDLGIAKQGKEFFKETFENSLKAVYPDDQALFHSMFTKENILRLIAEDGVFVFDYRLVTGDNIRYVRLKAASVEENGKTLLIIALFDEDAQIRQEMKYESDLSIARNLANRDALTGVKNKYAYYDAEKQLDLQIEKNDHPCFAIVICDVNSLKTINDTKGHKEGDRYIQNACTTICRVFKFSPVFRIGGDEFTVICQGHDYEHIDELLEEMKAANSENEKVNEVQIAYGMSKYEADENVETVFERADKLMYEHKAKMKGLN